MTDSYTIERIIHGMEAIYNDIHPWNHTDLLHVFGGSQENSTSYQVKTKSQVEALFRDQTFSSAPHIQLVEVFMPWQDAPRALLKIGQITASMNAKA